MNASGTHLLSMALVVVACARPATPGDTQADVAAINAVREREMAAVNSGVIDSLPAIYSADIAMMPPNEPAVNGLEALRGWFETTLSQVTLNGRYVGSQVTVFGDWAVDRYTAVLTATPKAGGGPMEEHVKGIHVMHREADGTWRIAQDVWNSDAAPPAATAPAPARR